MNRAQQYLLPITVLIEIMKDVPEIISLHAQMPSLPGISEEASLAEIVVGCGRIHACTITTTGGQRLLQQEAAFSALAQLGELEWHIGSLLPLRGSLQNGSLPQQSDTPQHRDEAIPQRAGLFIIPAFLIAVRVWRSRRSNAIRCGSPWPSQHVLKAVTSIV